MVIKLDVRKRFTGRPRMLTRDLFAVAILLFTFTTGWWLPVPERTSSANRITDNNGLSTNGLTADEWENKHPQLSKI